MAPAVDDFPVVGLNAHWKAKPMTSGGKTERVKNGPVRIEKNGALSAAIAGVWIRPLAKDVARHREEVRGGLT